LIAADPAPSTVSRSANEHTVETEPAFTHGSIVDFEARRSSMFKVGTRKAAELCRRTGRERLRVLEVGCGTAGLYEPLAAAGHSYMGVDIDKRMVGAAAARGVPSRVADLYQLDEAPFDAVLFSQVLEHSREPEIFLHHVHRLLKDGGVAVCDVPNHDSLAGLLSRLPVVRRNHRYGAIELPHHSYAYTAAPLRLLFTRLFADVEVFTRDSLDPIWGQGMPSTPAVWGYHKAAAAIRRPSLVVAAGRR